MVGAAKTIEKLITGTTHMGRPDSQFMEAVLAHLRNTHPGMCRHWFDNIEPIQLARGTLKLLVHEPVQLRYLQRCCVEQFVEAAQAVTGQLLAVRFVGEEELNANGNGSAHEITVVSNAEAARRASVMGNMLISPDYCFENFVVGPGNRLAHAAAVAVSSEPGRAYNPFFIHSAVGLGKTHLLQSICQAAMRKSPNLRVYYTSCNDFMTEFLEAVQVGQMSEFRHRYRNIDLLMIDDIHDVSKRERTQEEFFHTFNSLYQAGKQIVLSSDAAPNEIPELEERLSSRFNCGLVAEIERPSFETRVAIVRNKAAMRNLHLPDDVVNFIAARVDSNIRDLEGTITKMQGLALTEKDAAIDMELAKIAVGEQTITCVSQHPSVQDILDAITSFYDVRLQELLSRRRQKSIALPRQVGMYLARRHTRYSLQEIGGFFGDRDHTTVMHAIRSIDLKRSDDHSLNDDIVYLESRLATNEVGAVNVIPGRT